MQNEWQKQLTPDHNPQILTDLALKELMTALPEWKLETEAGITKLVREIKFPDFICAFAYLSKIALISQMLDHHAEIGNVYNFVSLKLYTHTKNKITALDEVFAHNAEFLI